MSETIDQLLTASVDELESQIREHDYAVSRDRLRAWRGQAEMATQIPMLRRSDAELLYAAGIQSTVELSRMRPESVYDLVIEFQNTQEGTRYRRSGRNIDRQQAINWSRWAQHSRTLTEARQSRSRFFVRSADTAAVGTLYTESPVSRRRIRISQGSNISRRQPRPLLSSEAKQQRDRRKNQRKQRLERRTSSYRTAAAADDNDDRAELRFFLNRSDEVEAAPSIGPKTAQRLAKVGVFTVDDLLNAAAENTAVQLDNRRINADVIRQWQNQARLICCVPGLRGHDSQILVACGVTEPEQLSAKRPADLYAVVRPFADTTEGERIIRGGKKPDLEEITDWIRWAQHARPLKSAA